MKNNLNYSENSKRKLSTVYCGERQKEGKGVYSVILLCRKKSSKRTKAILKRQILSSFMPHILQTLTETRRLHTYHAKGTRSLKIIGLTSNTSNTGQSICTLTLCRSKVWIGMKVLQPNSIILGTRKLWWIFPIKQKFDTRAAFLDNPKCSIWSNLTIFLTVFSETSRLHNGQKPIPKFLSGFKHFYYKKKLPWYQISV